MHVTRLMTAAAFAALMAGSAAAQSTTTTAQPATPTEPGHSSTAPGHSSTAPGQTGMTGGVTNNASTAGAMSGQSMTAPGQTGLTAGMSNNASLTGTTMSMNGSVQVTANAPIPDTPENRARYGQPESRAGRMKLGEGPVQALPTAGRALARSRTSAQAE